MNKRLGTVLLFALLVSGGASALLYRLIGGAAHPAPVQRISKVLVALHVLESGQVTKAEDVRLIDWIGMMPPGVIHAVAPALNRGVIGTIYEGEPLVENRLAAKGAGGGLAATIPPGMRAVAVRANEVVGVSGFVVPGMRVDVIIAGNPPGNNMTTTTRTILQNIEVLSAGQKFQHDAEGKPVSVPVINLLVTPQQAEVLSLAANEERIQLVLRNPTDHSVAETKGVDVLSLFKGGSNALPTETDASQKTTKRAVAIPVASATKADPAGPVVIEVIEGTKRSEVRVEPVGTAGQ